MLQQLSTALHPLPPTTTAQQIITAHSRDGSKWPSDNDNRQGTDVEQVSGSGGSVRSCNGQDEHCL